MKTCISVTSLLVAAAVLPAAAQVQTRRASIVGGGGDQGRCTIEVEVDGAAEVSVSGDQGNLRTLNGQPAVWRRFECTGMPPRNPADFRFQGVDGRGKVDLVSDPRGRGGAVIRIEDPEGGREGYTFELQWTGGSSTDGGLGQDGGFGRNDRRRGADNRRGRDDTYSRRDEGLSRGNNEQAVQACRDAITDRISRDGYTRVNIRSAQVDNNPGRNDYIVGTAVARGRGSMVDFEFSCAMNINNGRVRSVQLNPR
jgi:hypothetical protein